VRPSRVRAAQASFRCLNGSLEPGYPAGPVEKRPYRHPVPLVSHEQDL